MQVLIPGDVNDAGVWCDGLDSIPGFQHNFSIEPLGDRNYQEFGKDVTKQPKLFSGKSSEEMLQRFKQHKGTEPEEPWTNVSGCGKECNSSQCFVVGVAAGVTEWKHHPQTLARKHIAQQGINPELELPAARAMRWEDRPVPKPHFNFEKGVYWWGERAAETPAGMETPAQVSTASSSSNQQP